MTGPFPFGRGKQRRKHVAITSEIASIESRSPTIHARSTPVEVTSPLQFQEPSEPTSTEFSNQTVSRNSSVRRRGKTRGATLEKSNASRREKLSVDIHDDYGRPTDMHQARNLQTMIGLAARQDLPLTKEYRLLSQEELTSAYDRINSRININGFNEKPHVKRAINRSLGKNRRDFLCRIKKKWEEKGDEAKPSTTSIADWEMLKEKWRSDKHKEKCTRNKEIRRIYVKNMHNSGSTSFVVRREEISREELDGGHCGEFLLFVRTHFTLDPNGERDPNSITGFKGKWVSAAAESNYRKMLEMRDAARASGRSITEGQICDEILNNERRTDYRIGIGYGPIPSPKRQSNNFSKVQLEQMEGRIREQVIGEMEGKMREQEERIREQVKGEMEQQFQSMMMNFFKGHSPLSDNSNFHQLFSGAGPSHGTK